MSSPPSRADFITAAYDLFREQGYGDVTLEDLARRTKSDLSDVRAQFHDKFALFEAVMDANSPLNDLRAALTDGVGDSAEDILRETAHRMIGAAEKHAAFFELAMVNPKFNHGTVLLNLSARLVPDALSLLRRLKRTGQLRPVSDMILARTLISMVIGFVASERAMPQVGRMAMRLIPQRGWLDGMIDLMLYGLLEDDQRW